MYKGIVLNKVQRDAFLSIADSEGLICERGMTDGIYQSRTRTHPSPQLVERVFEQFVVAGAVYVDPFTYRCLDGELVEQKMILPYEKTDKNLDFHFFDILTVQKMLIGKGYSAEYYTEERIQEIFNVCQDKAKEYIVLEQECGSNPWQVLFKSLNGFGVGEDKIKAERYFQLRQELFENDVFNVLTEYQELLNIAYYNDLLCPVVNVAGAQTVNPVMEGKEAVTILRYTSNKLNKISTAGTLRKNMSLVQREEAKAYRSKVGEWMTALSNQDFDDIQIVEDEIIRVQKAMKYKKNSETIGRVIATIGATSSVLAHSKPELAILAEVVTYAGLVPAFYDPMKRKKYLWASFGLQ